MDKGRGKSFDDGPGGTGEPIPSEARKLLNNFEFMRYWDGRFRSSVERKEAGEEYLVYSEAALDFDWDEFGRGLILERQKDLAWFQGYEPLEGSRSKKVRDDMKAWRSWHLPKSLGVMVNACRLSEPELFLDVSAVVPDGEWAGWKPTPKEYFEDRESRLLGEAGIVCGKLWALAWAKDANKFAVEEGKRTLHAIHSDLVSHRSFIEKRGHVR